MDISERQLMDSARWERESLILNREQFLRDKLYSLHIFLSKTLIALISSTLALSVGFIGYINKADVDYTYILPMGWACLGIGLICQMFVIRYALEYYYGCYNNHMKGKTEHCNTVLSSEKNAIRAQRSSFCLFFVGISLILTFVFINL